MGHIELSRSADLVVVAPATADLMAKAANGLADDLASTTLLATDKPVLMAPAMNVRMWLHAATQRNLARLKADGVTLRRARRRRDGLRRVRARAGWPSRRRSSTPRWRCWTRRGGGRCRQARADHRRPHRRADRPGAGADQPLQRQAGLRHRRGAGGAGRAGDAGLRPDRARRAARRDARRRRDRAARCWPPAEAALPADAAVCVAAVADWRADEVFAVKLKKSQDGPPTHPPGREPRHPGDPLRPRPDAAEAGGRLRRRDQRPRGARPRQAEAQGLRLDRRQRRQRRRDHGRRRERGAAGLSARAPTHWPRASKAEVARRLAGRIAEDLA